MIMGDLKIRCVAVGSWRRAHDDIGRRRVIDSGEVGVALRTVCAELSPWDRSRQSSNMLLRQAATLFRHLPPGKYSRPPRA
jgi:hypothetical protein